MSKEIKSGGYSIWSCTSASTDTNPAMFTYSLSKEINNEKHNLEVGLMTGQFTYFIPNCTTALGNHLFKYSVNGGTTWETINFDGNMIDLSLADLKIKAYMMSKGHWDSVNNLFYISLAMDQATGRVLMSVSNSYQVDLRNAVSTFNTLLGFNTQLFNTDGTKTAENKPNFNLGRMAFNIHCDIIAGASDGANNQTDILACIIPEVSPNEAVIYSPPTILFLPVNTGSVKEIRFRITDQYGTSLTITGDPTTISLAVRAV